jgi:hypothetical protein
MGKIADYCKSQKGSYGQAEDLGYAFTTSVLGSVEAKASYNDDKKDSCFAIEGGDDGCGEGTVEDLGTAAFLLDEAAWDAWSQCGKQPRTDEKYNVVIEAVVNGEVAKDEPNTERVAWAAFNQGAFLTSKGTAFQAGIAYVPADGEFHEIMFHEKFGAAPVVVSNPVGPVGSETQEIAVTSYAASTEFGGRYPEFYAAKSGTQLTDGAVIEDWTSPKRFVGVGFDRDTDITFDLAGTTDVSEVTIGYGVKEAWGATAPAWVQVHCSADGKSYEAMGDQNAGFTGKELHNDLTIALEAKPCLKVKLELRFKGTSKFVLDEVTFKGSVPTPMTIRQREADADKFYVKADGDGVVQVHWVAFEKKAGYLSSYPFVAGIENDVGAEAKELVWADVEGMKTEKFTQMPLVFASVATDRSDGAVDVRLPENTPTKMKMELQGSSTAEKISYFVFQGAGYIGSIMKAVPTLPMSYEYSVEPWGNCEAEGKAAMGKRTRGVKCLGANGAEYSDLYCPGAPPATEEPCQITTFFIMNAQTGRCLNTKDSIAKKKGYTRWRHECSGDYNRYRVEPTGDGDGSFWLQNYASGLCLTTKNNKVSVSSKLWFKKCEGEKNKMIMETKENGAVVIYAKQKDKKFCLQTSASFAKLNEDGRWKKGGCDKFKNELLLVDGSGPAEVTDYSTTPKSNAGAKWYLDDGLKLNDGELSGSWKTSTTQKGVGWIVTTAKITLNLKEAGPIGAVVLGYNVKNKWDCKVPAEVKVSCSADGSSWGDAVTHGKGDFKDTGEKSKGNAIAFDVAKVCTGDEKHVLIEAKPQPSPKGKEVKMIFDEIDVYRPAVME